MKYLYIAVVLFLLGCEGGSPYAQEDETNISGNINSLGYYGYEVRYGSFSIEGVKEFYAMDNTLILTQKLENGTLYIKQSDGTYLESGIYGVSENRGNLYQLPTGAINSINYEFIQSEDSECDLVKNIDTYYLMCQG